MADELTVIDACEWSPPADGETLWCARHQCEKTRRWQQLCARDEKYRQLWDDGRGPGQPREVLTPVNTSEQAAPNKRRGGCRKPGGCGKSLVRRAASATRAGVRFVADRCRTTTEAVRQERVALCEACEHFDPQDRACLSCRCYVDPKVRLPLESCPEGKWAAQAREPRPRSLGGAFRPIDDRLPEFVTTHRLWEDVKHLASLLPADVAAVAGVARSGLNAGTMLSMLLHVPLFAIRQSEGDIISAGSGWRLGRADADGRVVVVDDTVMTGNSLKAIEPLVRGQWPGALLAAVYVNPRASTKPDLFARELPWPHLLEWNLFNSVLSPNTAVDFNGVLCRDPRPDQDDDGERYRDFLANAPPLYLARKVPISLIVTARLETYRAVTEQWLARHRIRCARLVMGPWRNNHERARSNIAAWKAEHIRRWVKRHRAAPLPLLFVESNDHLARQIARKAKVLTVCTDSGRIYR